MIVLNGGSSSGKSGIARCLQAILPDPWLVIGVDTLIRAMPVSSRRSVVGIEFASNGAVIVGAQFRALEAAWIEGVAAMARAGDRVFGQAASQADVVHQGVVYDLQVDTTRTEALACARAVAARAQSAVV